MLLNVAKQYLVLDKSHIQSYDDGTGNVVILPLQLTCWLGKKDKPQLGIYLMNAASL
ncbi:hypothetical protein OZY43_00245 [Lactobacillus sp. ESL0785]|uniref:hypothetical protein n=1 Tax=Lactobacillus sp. ESL0785 TaxID=2983232 RepID=UPI0023F842B9|nr:hypothetical protein [Lactobacillus sp. ESL0785]WEV70911.1 hypothetical protein OZY43_00245 [Lactobacillus sp. ESL0785]